MVLTGLFYHYFIENLQNFPNSLICVSKQDILNIHTLEFGLKFDKLNLSSSSTIDLSKLSKLCKCLYNTN